MEAAAAAAAAGGARGRGGGGAMPETTSAVPLQHDLLLIATSGIKIVVQISSRENTYFSALITSFFVVRFLRLLLWFNVCVAT